MEPTTMTVWDMAILLFWTPYNVLVVTGAWASVVMVGKIIPDGWVTVYRKHVVPAQYMVLCMAAVWTPSLFHELQSRDPGAVTPEGEVTGVARLAVGATLSVAAYVAPIIMLWAAGKWLPENVVKQIKKVLS